jgi:predicted DNA-binding protein (MmcQ/YjbR family)
MLMYYSCTLRSPRDGRLARAHWVQVQDAKALVDAVARELVGRSHDLVFSRLTRKQQTEIGSAPAPHR